MSEKILSDILEQVNNMTMVQHEIKSDTTKMQNDCAEIKIQTENIPSIKIATLETKKIVERVESTQERHEKTLDLLSRRSIDQEAELKRIKLEDENDDG